LFFVATRVSRRFHDRVVSSVKKQDRTDRAARRSRQVKEHNRQDASIGVFVHECCIAMAPSDCKRFHAEAKATAGFSFHLFDAMVDDLSRTKTGINPGLHKAIESVLDFHDLDRNRISSLSTLQ
jgi:hypothetical protein